MCIEQRSNKCDSVFFYFFALVVDSSDYSLMPAAMAITIPSSGSTGCVSVSATDDPLIEGDETFSIVITIMTNRMAKVNIGVSNTTTVTILDNDGMLFE